MIIPAPAKVILRFLSTILSRFANRRFFFTFTALAVLNAKLVHIYDHQEAVHPHLWREWSYSFVGQDMALLTVIRLLLDHWIVGLPFIIRLLVTFFNGIFMVYNAAISIVFVSFYLVAGSEIHLRNVSLPTDPSSRALMLSGSLSFALVLCMTFSFAWALQNICYGLFGYPADIANWPFAVTWRLSRQILLLNNSYSKVPQFDVEEQAETPSHEHEDISSDNNTRSNQAGPRFTPRILYIVNLVAYALATLFILMLAYAVSERPAHQSLIFLSWTPALLPFVDLSASSPLLQNLPTLRGAGIQRQWDKKSALSKPIKLDWLPNDTKLSGFEDWYEDRNHYNADVDPLRISNLDQDLLSELRNKLQDVPIRHVLLFFLESTRNDVFPIKNNSLIWNTLAESYPDHKLPQVAQDRLATLTPTANFITGDYDDGFKHAEADKVKRGGVHFSNAHTTATYTIKSLVGTLCGISPLMADFNLEYEHHVYQPCLAQVFNAMNQVSIRDDDVSSANADSKWQSYFYQAATMAYDKQHELISKLGFPEEHIINREYLRAKNATHGPVTLPNINAFAFEEDPLEDYIRDAFVSAKEKDERVFLTHLTSTSHHAFKMPEHEKYIPVANGLDMLSHYINTEGYADKWLRKVLNLLDEQGVANETLIVFVGDHGLSLPENNIVSPYYNPNVGIDHVPLVLSHPLLPAFDVHDAVHSSQILPTILDILVETGSLNNASQQVASDLVRNYEGQSLIRPQVKQNEATEQGNWQFTIVNPGRAMITARDARYPERHLVIPLIDNVEWRFSNLTSDPTEQSSVQGFDYGAFTDSVEAKFGTDVDGRDGAGVARWIEEGASIARWWAEENSKRWRYGPYSS
ncbi:lipoteichoic acid synthase yvgj [Fusarium heterosporum]|uniref:Lipoteichoic acid synthase yvgj n=1 Tax=Fusarium heterosporum TaxID=42747 RepID=A0A8H5SYJ3_FUSHE|nr:lipoteichoic acid synthase yvgj [Fusarium heterosporum]